MQLAVQTLCCDIPFFSQFPKVMSKVPQPHPAYKRGTGQTYVLSCNNICFASSKHMFQVVWPDPKETVTFWSRGKRAAWLPGEMTKDRTARPRTPPARLVYYYYSANRRAGWSPWLVAPHFWWSNVVLLSLVVTAVIFKNAQISIPTTCTSVREIPKSEATLPSDETVVFSLEIWHVLRPLIIAVPSVGGQQN